jgi:hypothetical protein
MKQYYRPLLLISLIFSGYFLQAQDGKYKDQISVEGLRYTKYIASAQMLSDIELLKPVTQSLGLEVNGYFRFFSKPKLRKGSSEYNPKISERELFVKPSFGFIYRRRYHTGIFFTPSLAFRNTAPKGFFVELNADAGYYFAKLNAPVYEMQPDGTFEEVGGGFSNVIVGGKLLAGFDLSKKYEIPFCLNAGFGIFYRYPNNTQWVRHVVLQAGVSYIFRRAKE